MKALTEIKVFIIIIINIIIIIIIITIIITVTVAGLSSVTDCITKGLLMRNFL